MDETHCDCEHLVPGIREGMLDVETIGNLSEFFKIFGDPTRIRMLWALHENELCVQSLGKCLGMSDSAISHQLKVLSTAGLVKSRRDGRNVYYSLCDEHIELVLNTALEHVKERGE